MVDANDDSSEFLNNFPTCCTFPTSYRMPETDPVDEARERNFVDGSVEVDNHTRPFQ